MASSDFPSSNQVRIFRSGEIMPEKMGRGAGYRQGGGGYHVAAGGSPALNRPCCSADIGALFCARSMYEK